MQLELDLFSFQKKVVIHKETGISIIAFKELEINNILHYDCLVPQVVEDKKKDKWYFANATYSINELIFK